MGKVRNGHRLNGGHRRSNGNFSRVGHQQNGWNHGGGGGRGQGGAGGSPRRDLSPATSARPTGGHGQTYGGNYRGNGRSNRDRCGWPATPGTYNNRANNPASLGNKRGFNTDVGGAVTSPGASQRHLQQQQQLGGDAAWVEDAVMKNRRRSTGELNRNPGAAAATPTSMTQAEYGRRHSRGTADRAGVRELLTSAVAQQTPRRRIEFHPATRPDTVFSTSGVSGIGLGVAAKTSGVAVGPGGSMGAAAVGGGGRRFQDETGAEKLRRLGDEKIGLPHAEQVCYAPCLRLLLCCCRCTCRFLFILQYREGDCSSR